MTGGRRAVLLLALAATRCSSGPDRAEALAIIAQRIKTSFVPGEKAMSNLVYRKSEELTDGSYAVFVDYELVSTIPQIGMFNTAVKAGEREAILAERYIFVRTAGDWVLQ
jgi:uncharacterized membrane-anchored protein